MMRADIFEYEHCVVMICAIQLTFKTTQSISGKWSIQIRLKIGNNLVGIRELIGQYKNGLGK